MEIYPLVNYNPNTLIAPSNFQTEFSGNFSFLIEANDIFHSFPINIYLIYFPSFFHFVESFFFFFFFLICYIPYFLFFLRHFFKMYASRSDDYQQIILIEKNIFFIHTRLMKKSFLLIDEKFPFSVIFLDSAWSVFAARNRTQPCYQYRYSRVTQTSFTWALYAYSETTRVWFHLIFYRNYKTRPNNTLLATSCFPQYRSNRDLIATVHACIFDGCSYIFSDCCNSDNSCCACIITGNRWRRGERNRVKIK